MINRGFRRRSIVRESNRIESNRFALNIYNLIFVRRRYNVRMEENLFKTFAKERGQRMIVFIKERKKKGEKFSRSWVLSRFQSDQNIATKSKRRRNARNSDRLTSSKSLSPRSKWFRGNLRKLLRSASPRISKIYGLFKVSYCNPSRRG